MSQNQSSSVVVIGSIMQDLCFSCDSFPANGETVLARLNIGQGGKGSNQAVASGRAGVRTTFVGAVGDDATARMARDFYRRNKIGCRLVGKKGSTSGTAIVLVDREGKNQVIIEPGANAKLSPADIPRSLLRRAGIVATQLEINPVTTAHVLRQARKVGVTTLLNPAPMRADFDTATLRHVDILVPNELEFVALVRRLCPGEQDFDLAALNAASWDRLHALCRGLQVPTVIVTLGARGCFVSEPGGYVHLPAHQGIDVVDTTGAGDAFCGGFAAGFVRFGGNIREAALLGNAVAALAVTRAGAAAAMPTKRQIERFLKGRNNGVGHGLRESAPARRPNHRSP